METVYNLTATEMAAAFTEWERRYREEPEAFMSDYKRFTTQTPENYGDGATATFLGYIERTKS